MVLACLDKVCITRFTGEIDVFDWIAQKTKEQKKGGYLLPGTVLM
jgi:hypothetical protein